jgi:hypothetical protein
LSNFIATIKLNIVTLKARIDKNGTEYQDATGRKAIA